MNVQPIPRNSTGNRPRLSRRTPRAALHFIIVLALALLVSAAASALSTNPCIPVRAPGIGEGFADLPGYSINLPTTSSTADDVSKGFRVVKIWPVYQQLAYENQLDPIFTNPNLDVIVFRPYSNQTATTQSAAQQETLCAGTASATTGFEVADIATDYGAVATLLYERYGSQNKTVILTGWEADNQIKYYPATNPPCAWPANPTPYRQLLETRQAAVKAVRLQYASSNLRVFHAVEINRAVTTLSVLSSLIPQMVKDGNAPDFISYSSWASQPANVATALGTIASLSGLSHDRIYVGEWGCVVGAPGSSDAMNRPSCFATDAANVFNWGSRLWFVWSYSGNGGYSSYDLVFGPTGPTSGCLTGSCVGLDSPNGFGTVNNGLPGSNNPVIQGINTEWYTHFTCP